MLSSLHIENVAVVKCADIDFTQGFSVLTGETGAGKSIIIDSINVLVGNKTGRELIRTGEEKATVSAQFDCVGAELAEHLGQIGIDAPDGCVILQKTLSRDGKSTSRINGRNVTQSALREIGARLVSIHGQNDTRALLSKDAHMELIDSFASDKLSPALASYRADYDLLCEKKRRLAALETDEAEKLRRREMLEYQINDIDALRLKDGEEERLEAENARLSNLEKISKNVNFAERALGKSEKGSAYLLERAATALGQLSDAIPEAGQIADRLMEYSYEISDIADRVAGFAEEPEGDPTVLIDKIQTRLEAISRLKRKYGATVADVLAYRADASKRLEELDGADKLGGELSREIDALEKKTDAAAREISRIRREASESSSGRIAEVLSFLDMPKVKFTAAVTPCEKNRNGCDDVEFMISANPGEPFMPLAKTASGGELSRVMLAIRCVLNADGGAECSIYDEVDTGISGKTSRKVGLKLLDVSKGGQVVCVTHSAQIASLADTHYKISKSDADGRTETSVAVLDAEQRVGEIARILGGIDVTEAQLAAARDMIDRKDVR